MRTFFTILIPVFLISISSQAQSIISNQDAAISLSVDMMQLSSGMSADVQRLVALTARGNQPISSKEAKMLTDRLSRDVDALRKNFEKLLKMVGKDKKLVIQIKNMIYELQKTRDVVLKLSVTVQKGSDSGTIKLGGILRDRLFDTKKSLQQIRQRLSTPGH